MCGIAGYIGSSRVAESRLEACLKQMGRRGPDGSGMYHHTTAGGRTVQLLHSRLSILDLNERAAQPMRFGSKVISFNGEIYNYKEIRRNLAERDIHFRTQCDTEVLLASLAVDGVEALDEMEGMWAFALYDEEKNTLLLSRDRFGEKPLYYFQDNSGLYFASEVKFLATLSGQQFSVNESLMKRFLVYGYKFLYKYPETFYHGVHEVPSGSCLKIRQDQRIEEFRYWSPALRQDENMSRHDALQGARDRLIQAMEIRLRADVPLAFCMSGGVDSNSLISIAKNVFGYDVHGFTVVNTDARYAEKELVDAAVKAQGLKHTSLFLSTDGFLPRLKQLVKQHDAPVYTISYYVQALLMESIAEHGYKISVSGTAADELFTGYYDHHNMYLAAMNGQNGYVEAKKNWEKYIKPVVRNPFLQDPEEFISNPQQRGQLSLGADDFKRILKDDFHESFTEGQFSDELLRNRMLNELFQEVVPVLLHEDDLNAMYYSIENRSPFLDRRLMEFCNSIPTRHLIHDGYNKSILRDAMREIVPDEILKTRKKVGFNAPIMELLDVTKPSVREEILNDSPIFAIVDRTLIEKCLENGPLSNSMSKFLFSFLGCKAFMELTL